MKSERTYFFLSGLPRTGITLLGAILNQNPDIYVSPTSPVLEFMEKFREIIDTNITYAAFPKEEFTKKTISKIWNDWYSDIDSPIIIDKNRGWPARLDWAGDIAKDIKIICPVRSILDILSSFVLLNRKAFEKKLSGFNRIHLASGKETSVNELAKAIISTAGHEDYPINYLSKRKGEVEKNFATYEYAKKILNFEPQTSLKKALKETWQWFNENHKT